MQIELKSLIREQKREMFDRMGFNTWKYPKGTRKQTLESWKKEAQNLYNQIKITTDVDKRKKLGELRFSLASKILALEGFINFMDEV